MIRSKIISTFFLLSVLCFGEIPEKISYQGKITDPGGIAIDGNHSMSFWLFDDSSGGSILWTESHPSVEIEKGLFRVVLGEYNPIDVDFDGDYYLAIAIDHEMLTPRIELTSEAYAFRAKYADSLSYSITSPRDTLIAEWDSIRNVPHGLDDGDDIIGIEDTMIAYWDMIRNIPACFADGSDDDDISNDVIGTLYDVNISSPSNDEVLRYDYSSGKWENSAVTVIGTGLPVIADNYIIVELDDGLNDQQRALRLQSAYNIAMSMASSAYDRVTIIVPPGRYNFADSGFHLTNDFIDIIGLTNDPEAQVIYGNPIGDFEPVLRQSAGDIRLMNLHIASESSSWGTAYKPEGSYVNTIIKNCRFTTVGFATMDFDAMYSGTYIDCICGRFSFGHSAGSVANGTFIDCRCGSGSFAGSGGTASGTFIRCEGGEGSFGGERGNVSGYFRDCSGGDQCFGHYNGCNITGTFINCTAGEASFGGGDSERFSGYITGKFINCIAEDFSFGYNMQVTGEFRNCHAGNNSFASGEHAIAAGKFYHCTGGTYSFGGDDADASGGEFYFCSGKGASFGIEGTPSPFFRCCDRNGVWLND